MSVALYMDEHVPGAITRALRASGVDVLTVQEDGLDGEEDPKIMDRAQVLNRVVFTQDVDFLIEACRRQRAGIGFSGVIFSRQGDLPIGKCIANLELIAKAGERSDQADKVEYLPL